MVLVGMVAWLFWICIDAYPYQKQSPVESNFHFICNINRRISTLLQDLNIIAAQEFLCFEIHLELNKINPGRYSELPRNRD